MMSNLSLSMEEDNGIRQMIDKQRGHLIEQKKDLTVGERQTTEIQSNELINVSERMECLQLLTNPSIEIADNERNVLNKTEDNKTEQAKRVQ